MVPAIARGALKTVRCPYQLPVVSHNDGIDNNGGQLTSDISNGSIFNKGKSLSSFQVFCLVRLVPYAIELDLVGDNVTA